MMKINIERIIPWVFRILLISFFLPPKVQTLVFILISASIIITSIILKIKFTRFEIFTAFILGGIYLFYLFYIPLTPPDSKHLVYSFLEREISLFLFPFVFLCLSKISNSSYQPYLIWFVYGNLVSSVIANLSILANVILGSMKNLNHITYRLAFENITHIHPTYFGMYLCLGIAILWVYNFEQYGISKWISLFFQAILVISLMMLMPKSALLSMLLIFIYCMIYIFKISIKLKIILSISLLGFAILLPLVIPFIAQRLNEVVSFIYHPNSNLINNSVDMRNLIFQTDLVLLKEHWLFGLGPVELQKHLDALLFLSSFFAGHALGTFNTHNEYLNQWLSFGLGGFIFFISILFIHFRKAILNQNLIYLFLLIILSITFLTENVLSRQQGVLFYSLFTSLFFFQNNISLKKKNSIV